MLQEASLPTLFAPPGRTFTGPKIADRFYLGPVLGTGSSATVFLAWDAVEREKVAIKRLDARAVWERKREGNLATAPCFQALREHPLLVCPQAVVWPPVGEREGDVDLFVLFKLQGQDCRTTLRQTGGLGLRDATRCIYDLLKALVVLHDQRLLHRDIKPEVKRC